MPTVLIVMSVDVTQPERTTRNAPDGDSPTRRLACGTLGTVDEHLIPSGYERTLPPGVQLTVRARRRTLAERAQGRVLDLGGANPHQDLWAERSDVDEAVVLDGAGDPRLLALARAGAPFDTVFSVFQLVSAPDLDATVRRIRDLLAPGGNLLFLEPARRPGLTGRFQAAIAPALAMATGWRIDRDVPLALRTGGLSVVDIERFSMPTTQWWLRVGILGRAHHAIPAARPDGD